MRANYTCKNCGAQYNLSDRRWRCDCGSYLDIEIDLNSLSFDINNIDSRYFGLWRYHKVIPVDIKSIVSFNEGYTPLVSVKSFGYPNAYFKLEYLFPTGSFKDRGTTVAVSKLNELGIPEFSMDSSGNAGASFAAYAALAGIKANIFVPYDTPEEKTNQIRIYGAHLIKIKGSKKDVTEAAMKYGEKTFYAGHQTNPYFLEGMKTMFYEMVEQMNWSTVDAVITPAGVGTIVLGIYKAAKELLYFGLIDKMPRIYAVQIANCAPIYAAYHNLAYMDFVKEDYCVKSLAEGVAIPNPMRLQQILEVIRETKGDIILVCEKETREGLISLSKKGLFVEPTSAIVFPALKKALYEHKIDSDEVAIAPLTGFGLKHNLFV